MIFLQKYIILPYWANISVESFIHSAFSIDGQCDASGIPHLQESGHSRHEWQSYARAYHCDTIGLEEMALPCFCIKMQPSPFLFPNFCRLFAPKITCLATYEYNWRKQGWLTVIIKQIELLLLYIEVDATINEFLDRGKHLKCITTHP